MTPLVWAADLNAPVKILALVGAVAIGAFVVGWLVQLIASAFGQKVPGVVLGVVRAAAGVGCGVLAYFWLFGTGAGGLGSGGWGFGRGKGQGDGTEQVKPKGDGDGKKNGKVEGKGGDALTIEVLGDAPLGKLAQRQGVTANLYRRYRVTRDDKKELLTLDEVKKLIQQRRDGPGLSQVAIVVYQDSPSEDQDWVKRLEDHARGLDKPVQRLQVSLSRPGENAPLD